MHRMWLLHVLSYFIIYLALSFCKCERKARFKFRDNAIMSNQTRDGLLCANLRFALGEDNLQQERFIKCQPSFCQMSFIEGLWFMDISKGFIQ